MFFLFFLISCVLHSGCLSSVIDLTELFQPDTITALAEKLITQPIQLKQFNDVSNEIKLAFLQMQLFPVSDTSNNELTEALGKQFKLVCENQKFPFVPRPYIECYVNRKLILRIAKWFRIALLEPNQPLNCPNLTSFDRLLLVCFREHKRIKKCISNKLEVLVNHALLKPQFCNFDFKYCEVLLYVYYDRAFRQLLTTNELKDGDDLLKIFYENVLVDLNGNQLMLCTQLQGRFRPTLLGVENSPSFQFIRLVQEYAQRFENK